MFPSTATPRLVTAVIPQDAAVSNVIDGRSMAAMIIKNNGTNWTAADIIFDVCETETGTFTPLKDNTGTVIRVGSLPTNAAVAQALPVGLFAAHYFKLHSVAVGLLTDVGQATAAQTIYVMMKA